ncbi:MAG TPA: hypothetical protein VIK55_06335 [Paludibacter sp.]
MNDKDKTIIEINVIDENDAFIFHYLKIRNRETNRQFLGSYKRITN